MALAYDTTSSVSDSSGQNSLTVSHTMSATSDGVLLVFAAMKRSATNELTATYNGSSMTRIFDSSSVYGRAVFVMFNPTSGTHDIVVTGSAGTVSVVIGVSFTGADTAGLGNANNTTNSSTCALTTTQNNSFICDFFTGYNSGGTKDASQTLNAGPLNEGGDRPACSSSRKQVVTAGASSMDWTGGDTIWGIYAVEVKEAPATTTSTSTTSTTTTTTTSSSTTSSTSTTTTTTTTSSSTTSTTSTTTSTSTTTTSSSTTTTTTTTTSSSTTTTSSSTSTTTSTTTSSSTSISTSSTITSYYGLTRAKRGEFITTTKELGI